MLEKTKQELKTGISNECKNYFGSASDSWTDFVADQLWNEEYQDARFMDLRMNGFLPGKARILDMAAGVGKFAFRALSEGYDCYGIEPEAWKLEFIRNKLAATDRPASWAERILCAVGEAMPFADDTFDCVTTYQTLEHVQDPAKVVSEMVRITRPGGGIHVRCPDYRSTYEAHYNLPWLPLFPRASAKLFLRLLGRPTKGLDTLQYITKSKILFWLRQVERRTGCRLVVMDMERVQFDNALRKRRLPSVPGAFALYKFLQYVKLTFRREVDINIFIRVVDK